MDEYEIELAPRKAELFGRALAGAHDVLELGIGSAKNLRFFPSSVRNVIGIDPNPFNFDFASQSAASANVPLRLVAATAEALPLEDASVDAVVSTLVFCSVSSPARVFAEAARVLRPGGRLVLIEHVAADFDQPLLVAAQTLLDPLQQAVAGGCHLRRNTEASLRAAAGFQDVNVERFSVDSVSLISPHLAGIAVRSA